VEARLGNVTDAATVLEAMQGVEAVVHLAALLHIVNPPPALREKYERINVGGTDNVVQAAIQAGVRRVVLASTIAVYGPSGGRVLDEESPTAPESLYAQTKLAAEQIVLAARRADGQPLGTVLRFGAIYGARIKGNYQRLVLGLARGRFIPVGNGLNRRSLVHESDVARAVLLAVRHPDAAGKVFNVTDGQFHSLREINAAICASLGHRAPRFYLPSGPARLAAGIVEEVAGRLGLRAPSLRASIDKYCEDVAVDSRRIQAELGFIPQVDLLSGWQETIREMRKSGEL
jgi:UDP-glucose 4-epimerase